MVEETHVRDLRDEFILCRTLGHAWDDNPAAQMNAGLLRISRGALALRCVRCTTERYDYIGKDMGVETRYYRYPEHYKTIKGQGRRPNLVGEMFRRSLLIRSARKRRNGSA